MLMRTRFTLFCSAGIAVALALSGCNKSVMLSPGYLGVTVSPRPESINAGTSITFTGTVSNNLSLPQWSFLDAAEVNNPGTLTAISGSPNAILYTAPATPPIYTASPTGVTQGSVTLNATVQVPPGTSVPVSGDSITFVITTPSVSLSLAPLTASVPLSGTQQFIGYAVGSINNTLTWQLSTNGVPSNSGVLGTINVGGTYVAPAMMPPSGNTVTVTIISQADPTKTLAATVTLH
jgi:hypothetical protein